MKRLLLTMTVVLFLAAGTAYAESFNFETTPLGNYTSLAMTSGSLTATLTRTSGNMFSVSATGGQPAGWGARDLENFDFGFPSGDAYNMNFSSAVTGFSIQFGDFGPSDSDSPITVTAYAGLNGTGAVLGTTSTTWSDTDSFPNFKSLALGNAGILSVRFSGDGSSFPNSMFWDNISVNNTAVPEPSSILLLGVGLAMVAGRLRSRRG